MNTYTFSKTAGGSLTQHLHSYQNQSQLQDFNRAIDLNNEGLRLTNRGRYEEAHQKLSQSLEIKERLHGHNTTMVALSLMNLGDNYLAWGKYDEAEKAGREALRIRRACRDPEARYAEELLDDVGKARRQAARARTAATAAQLPPPAAAAASAPAAEAPRSQHNTAGSSGIAAAAGTPSSNPAAAAGSSGSDGNEAVAVEVQEPVAAAPNAAAAVPKVTAAAPNAAAAAPNAVAAVPNAATAASNPAAALPHATSSASIATCDACGIRGARRPADATPELPHLKKCSACRAARYCSKECQTRDWPRHKAGCQAAAAL